jgi:hypothetical protein
MSDIEYSLQLCYNEINNYSEGTQIYLFEYNSLFKTNLKIVLKKITINCNNYIDKLFENTDIGMSNITCFKYFKIKRLYDYFQNGYPNSLKGKVNARTFLYTELKSISKSDFINNINAQDPNKEFSIIYKYSQKVPILIALIYKYFDEFEILIPYLQDLYKYTQKSIIVHKSIPDYLILDSILERGSSSPKELFRVFPFTLGTYILLKKYKGIFSQLFTFLYFYVKYLKENNVVLDNFDYIITDKMKIYLSQYVVINKISVINHDLEYYEYLNTIYGHIHTGGSIMPHFFISFSDNKYTANRYYITTMNTVESIKRDWGEEIKIFPVVIYIQINKDNKAYYNSTENDYIFCPYISEKHILYFKYNLVYNPSGILLSSDDFNYEKEFGDYSLRFGGNTKIKKSIKKNILGKERRIYKKLGDRKEYVKYKRGLITVKEYRKLINNIK